ncbi:RNA polymerase II largest subunit [Tanacetum coccineum]|uniref:DNA-directed RNA polymerase subunit n=1 Tax=Tanacetum coccineum TaxID=301880 RepID=A0ABQ5J1R8_9ASTR
MDIRFSYSPAEVAKVHLVQFGILSPDEIVRFSLREKSLFCKYSMVKLQRKGSPKWLSAERVLSLLKRISDDDCLLWGTPWTPNMLVPADCMILHGPFHTPSPVRPSVMMDTSTRFVRINSVNFISLLVFYRILKQDDLTHQLATIIRHNESLRRQECNGAPAHVISEFSQLLQFHIAAYFDNELPGQPRIADFDGDEMNMHVPQSCETRAEILELMMVPKCIVSPQANRPVMSIVQDTLLGCRKITKRDTFIEKDVLLGTYYVVGGLDGKVQNYLLKPRLLWTGKQVFSLIIPKQINLIRTAAWHSESETGYLTPGDTQVRIEKGEEEVGPDAASKFLGHTQWLVNYWLLQQGFSIGIGDTIADASTMETINETILRAKNEVNGLIRAAQDKQLEAEPGRTMMESFENKVNHVLNKARDDAGSSAQKSLSESNNLNVQFIHCRV